MYDHDQDLHSDADGPPAPHGANAVGQARSAIIDARKYQDYVVNDAPAPAVASVPPQA